MSHIDDDKNIQKLLQVRLLYFMLTIPHQKVFKNFYLRNKSLLVVATSITCTIPCQRLFVPNFVFVGVILGTSLEEIAAVNHFKKPEN